MSAPTPEILAFDGGHDPAQASHEALQAIRRQLRRHPVITSVEGLPHDALHTELRASVDPSSIGLDVLDGTVTVRWFTGDRKSRPRFTFHYSDQSGFDCGWHHHEQEHLDEWGHYQEQTSEDADYSYKRFDFGSTEPARVVWEVLEELQTVLERLEPDESVGSPNED